MDRHFILRPSTWLGTFALCSLAICWAVSVHRMDLITWTIGPGGGGCRVVQLSLSNGVASLFLGVTGFFREPGLHYDSRVFAPDENQGAWFPKLLKIDISSSGLNIEIAIWLLFVFCAASWLVWVLWRSAQISRIRNNAE